MQFSINDKEFVKNNDILIDFLLFEQNSARELKKNNDLYFPSLERGALFTGGDEYRKHGKHLWYKYCTDSLSVEFFITQLVSYDKTVNVALKRVIL